MIYSVIEKTKHFLQEALDVNEREEDVRVVGVVNAEDGWIAEAEVVERSRHLPTHRVFETKYYRVKLDENQEVYAFKQLKYAGDREED
ncbi:MAG TPA: gas vesicle protein GvpO [Ktedonobacteraceae bacterium]|jgi:hypothetical protein